MSSTENLVSSISLGFAHRSPSSMTLSLSALGAEKPTALEELLRNIAEKPYDETIVVGLLQNVLDSKQEKSAARGLRGQTAVVFMNFLLQDVLDQLCLNLQHPLSRRRSDARRLLIKIAKFSNELPESLYLRDVKYCTSGPVDRMGGFSDVYRGSWDRRNICVKRLRTGVSQSGEPANVKRDLCREALTCRTVCHAHLLPLLGVEEPSGMLCLISPWMERGNLMEFQKKELKQWKAGEVPKISSSMLISLLAQVADAVTYLHAEKVVHGDLRPENVLIDDLMNARVGDFGLTIFSDDTLGIQSKTGGANRYMAPEQLIPSFFNLEESKRTRETDVYSFAYLALQAYTLHVPFHKQRNSTEVVMKVVRGERPDRPRQDECCGRELSDTLWELATKCWDAAASSRPTMAAAFTILAGIRDSM